MTSRHLHLLASGSALAMLSIAVLSFMLIKPVQISRETLTRIQPGMTQQQVESIIGGPPGDYCSDRVVGQIIDGNCGCMAAQLGRLETWEGDGGSLHIVFDNTNTVIHSEFWKPIYIIDDRPVLLRWLCRLWRSPFAS